jgi:hypothetical protein
VSKTEGHDVKELELSKIKGDLYQYLQNRNSLISPEFCKVVTDATRFVAAVAQNGFEPTFAASPAHLNVQADRPFIEVAEALVDHQIRFVRQTDRELVQKSLLEAYMHIAGPRYVFEPTHKTRFVQSLRRSEPRKFAALLLSLHLYNLVCALIQDDLRRRIANVKSFQLYLLSVETICRDVVKDSIKRPAAEIDTAWAKSVIRSIEDQLRHRPVVPAKSPNLSIPTGLRK